jgi:glyoxylase-like metal-dependent hydrolase (beta-lactamase superfamily II)
MHSSQFTFEPVGSGVYAAIAKPGAGSTSNSGIVDMGSATLVFDTSLTPQGAKDLRTAARLLTGRDPSIVVNSHWHLDHTLGNQVFGGCSIFSTERTLEELERRGPEMVRAISDPTWGIATIDLQARASAETRPGYREELQTLVAARRDLAAGRDLAIVRLPDETFVDRFRFPGERGVVLIPGAGHSPSDTVLWVHDAEVLFAGDLVSVRTHPSLESAELPLWIDALGHLEESRPRVVVPGHGPVGDAGDCSELRAYLEAVRDRTLPGLLRADGSVYGDWAAPSNRDLTLARLRPKGAPQP